MKKKLRYGFTTGACAAAAARGAALMLRDRSVVEEVEILLPAGIAARFRLQGQVFTADAASCFVVKDAGDDPDVTNGAEIHATVRLNPPSPPFAKGGDVIIQGGTGIGRVTKPGLAVPVGEWAINPVPRRMIEAAIREVFPFHCSPFTVHCLLSIPDGAELAKKTLNARLGIMGGLSILGTTGIVRPVSTQAWTDTIDAAMDVALACGAETVVVSTGRTSELAAQKFFASTPPPFGHPPCETGGAGGGTLPPEEAFIMMGDHVGHALRAASRKGVKRVVVAGQFAKMVKIACGHEQTHVSSSALDLQMLAQWFAVTDPRSPIPGLCLHANTAREVLERSGSDPLLIQVVCDRAGRVARGLATGTEIKVLLAGYDGEVLYFR